MYTQYQWSCRSHIFPSGQEPGRQAAFGQSPLLGGEKLSGERQHTGTRGATDVPGHGAQGQGESWNGWEGWDARWMVRMDLEWFRWMATAKKTCWDGVVGIYSFAHAAVGVGVGESPYVWLLESPWCNGWDGGWMMVGRLWMSGRFWG